jgi:arylsulfatase A-like enzyme
MHRPARRGDAIAPKTLSLRGREDARSQLMPKGATRSDARACRACSLPRWLASAMALFAVSTTLHCTPQPPREPIKKVVLITVDTLRTDRLGCYGYTARPTTPFIDSWAPETLLFERAFAQAPWTVPSMGSLLTGHYPREAGAYTNRGDLNDRLSTLPQLFRERGFRTASFNTNPLVMRRGFRRGFEYAVPESTGTKVPFGKVEPLLMQWLGEHTKDKFFIWVHDSDTHAPPTEGNPYLTTPGWKGYDAEVRWVDEAMRQIVNRLRELGILDETLVILTADHGEAFGEHGLGGHQNVIYDEVLRVPLLLRYPGMKHTGRTMAEVEVLDLFPTILELAGLPIPPGTRGESLVPIAEGRADRRTKPYAFATRYYFLTSQPQKDNGLDLYQAGDHHLAVRDEKWKLIVKLTARELKESAWPEWDPAAEGARLELYNTLDDPREQHNMASHRSEVVANLRGALAAHNRLITAAAKHDAPKPARPDAATLEALRQLGYE